MSTTLIPTKVPIDYYSQERISFIKSEVARILSLNFTKIIIINDEDVKKVLMRVLDERLEEDYKMTQRAIMYIVNEIKSHQLERMRSLQWEKKFPFVNMPYDNLAKSGPDLSLYKPSKQPSTLRFYFSSGF